MPWSQLIEWVSPSLGGAIVLSAAVLFAWYRGWFVSGAVADGYLARAEKAETKVIALLEEQISEYRNEKKTAEIVAEARRQEIARRGDGVRE